MYIHICMYIEYMVCICICVCIFSMYSMYKKITHIYIYKIYTHILVILLYNI